MCRFALVSCIITLFVLLIVVLILWISSFYAVTSRPRTFIIENPLYLSDHLEAELNLDVPTPFDSVYNLVINTTYRKFFLYSPFNSSKPLVFFRGGQQLYRIEIFNISLPIFHHVEGHLHFAVKDFQYWGDYTLFYNA